MVTTGKDTAVVFTIEDGGFAEAPGNAFDSDPSSDGYTFGANVTLGTNEGSNNAERVFRPNSRQAEHIVEQQFDGSFSVDFNLSSPWFLGSVFGNPSTTGADISGNGTDDQWTHVFEGKFPNSLQILEQTTYSSGRVDHRHLQGCVVSSVDVDISTEGLAEISLDGAYADEILYTDVANNGDTTYSEISQPKSNRPFHFGQAKFYMNRAGNPPGSSDIEGRIQDASLSLEGNVEMVYELGTRLGVDFSALALEPDISYTRLVAEGDEKDSQDMYGTDSGSSPRSDPGTFDPDDPTMGEDNFVVWLEFNNGKAVADSTDQNIIRFICTGGLTDSLSKNNIGDPESEIEHDIDRLINTVKVEAVNETDAAPWI